MEITEELFVIPNQDAFFLFAPLLGVVLEVNSGIIKLLRRIQYSEPGLKWKDIPTELISNGIVVGAHEKCTQKNGSTGFAQEPTPTSATLMPTRDCNLRCIYCFANAGEYIDMPDMDISLAKRTVDFLIQNAIKKNSKGITINFHGGGEPLYNWTLIVDTILYAESQTAQKDLSLRVIAGTNGILTDSRLNWLVKHFDHLTISLDGPEDIQNVHRPPKSFDRVMSTIGYLERIGFDYGIRVTVSILSVHRIVEIVDFIHDITTVNSIHLEPLYECGRCATTKTQAPDPSKFLYYYEKAAEKASDYGIKVSYSNGHLDFVSDRYCGAQGTNLLVTPEGDVSSCYEVTHPADPRAAIFYYGFFNQTTGTFEFDLDKLDYLRNRTVENIPYCKDCIAKFNCAGDCAAKAIELTGNIYDPSRNPRCSINQGTIISEITHMFREDKNGRNPRYIQAGKSIKTGQR